jgi:hypothetical protein
VLFICLYAGFSGFHEKSGNFWSCCGYEQPFSPLRCDSGSIGDEPRISLGEKPQPLKRRSCLRASKHAL